MKKGETFAGRYGPWALVAGGSEGLGAAYAEALAKRGLNLVLIARRPGVLKNTAERLAQTYKVEVIQVAQDLADFDAVKKQLSSLSYQGAAPVIGLLVYNAAHAPVGLFDTVPEDDLRRTVSVNVAGPLLLSRLLMEQMARRGRGGIVLMSSLAGTQGSRKLSSYAASKAYNAVLAEGLWIEGKARGVDVLACAAGAILTPGYAETQQGSAPGALRPEQVAETALKALGKKPLVVPGATNKIARFLMGRLLPRKAAVKLMAKNTESLS